MKFARIHRFNVTPRRAAAMQVALRPNLVLRDGRVGRLRVVAGADVSYDRLDDAIYAAVVVLTLPGFELIERVCVEGRARFPYIPGLLSFREIPILLKAFARLKQVPQLLLCDGQGIAHPRGIGLAAHLGLILGIPTIGCAKSLLVGTHPPVASARGGTAPLMFAGRRVGTVLRTRASVAPIYVSPGHLVSVRSCARLALTCCDRYRLPEPTRRAHIEVNRARVLARTRAGQSA